MTRKERGYILRVRRQGTNEDDYVTVSTFTVTQYQCGLKEGDKLRLKQGLPIEDQDGCSQTRVSGGQHLDGA